MWSTYMLMSNYPTYLASTVGLSSRSTQHLLWLLFLLGLLGLICVLGFLVVTLARERRTTLDTMRTTQGAQGAQAGRMTPGDLDEPELPRPMDGSPTSMTPTPAPPARTLTGHLTRIPKHYWIVVLGGAVALMSGFVVGARWGYMQRDEEAYSSLHIYHERFTVLAAHSPYRFDLMDSRGTVTKNVIFCEPRDIPKSAVIDGMAVYDTEKCLSLNGPKAWINIETSAAAIGDLQ